MGKNVTPEIAELQKEISEADCYLIISPEYNHVVPPALASFMGHFGGSTLMGHFGGSLYECKPSGIVTYSLGPFGGTQAAMTICTMCHELSCLPVSRLACFPVAHELFDKDGSPVDPNH